MHAWSQEGGIINQKRLFPVGSQILSLDMSCGSLTWSWDFAASSW